MASKRSSSCGGSWWLVAATLLLFLVLPVNGESSPDRKSRAGQGRGHGHGHGHGHWHMPLMPMRPPNSPVQLHESDHHVVMDNGNVEVTLNNPQGDVIGIRHGGIDNLLEFHHKESNRGVDGTKFEIITQTEDTVEISFVRTWENSTYSYVSPLIIDRRYIMRRNVSGFYAYAILEHPEGWPAFEMGQARVVYKLNGQKFHFMAMSDDRQRVMPTEQDRSRGETLAYKEAVLITHPSNPELQGEVDDKYQYSGETDETKVRGWISDDPKIGFWMITPSDEFHAAGPLKQELTNHVGPVLLNMFMSRHFAGRDINAAFGEGEEWKKVFGPYMVYINSATSEHPSSRSLWEDAKHQMKIETESWPYDFTRSKDYPHSSERGTVSGQLFVRDRYMNENDMPGASAYVGLAAPGEVGSWQQEGKGYQFWTGANEDGHFVIKNIRAGVYNLYAWVPGFIGDYKYEDNIIVTEGSEIRLDGIVYEPPRYGPTIWEMGIPDRKADEFYVPDPSPMLVNKLFINSKPDRFRQYGLWSRYSEIYPDGDPVYTIGASDYTKDWYFAHVTRDNGNSTFVPTTRTINFELPRVYPWASYRLQIVVAASQAAQIQVRFNDPWRRRPQFSTRTAGWDNAIARHGIHGLYHLYSFEVPWYYLRLGTNTLSLTQPRAWGAFTGLMYDYIRFEGPPR
ncbi:hypothetical protein CDL15_Pgr013382 [Punica granatum]|uniref:rhamnogalacturonan endolyase n=1 Tax=Punica granatum TaxID=22663 RepID=A0A218W087_PUNGR|nr:hypothetical protein CDL15_Pgr013382 [Punica granatum]